MSSIKWMFHDFSLTEHFINLIIVATGFDYIISLRSQDYIMAYSSISHIQSLTDAKLVTK